VNDVLYPTNINRDMLDKDIVHLVQKTTKTVAYAPLKQKINDRDVVFNRDNNLVYYKDDLQNKSKQPIGELIKNNVGKVVLKLFAKTS
jgi:hypothetical protein